MADNPKPEDTPSKITKLLEQHWSNLQVTNIKYYPKEGWFVTYKCPSPLTPSKEQEAENFLAAIIEESVQLRPENAPLPDSEGDTQMTDPKTEDTHHKITEFLEQNFSFLKVTDIKHCHEKGWFITYDCLPPLGHSLKSDITKNLVKITGEPVQLRPENAPLD